MHCRLQRIIIFILCIAIPFSALAEPARWLDPWIHLTGEANNPRTGVITFSISPDGYLPVLEAEYESMISYQKYLGKNDEEVEAYYNSMAAMIQGELISAHNTLSAMNALFKELSVRYVLAKDCAQFTLIFQKEPVMTFAVTETEQGQQLLTSDLFPSYALNMNQQAFNRMTGMYPYGVHPDALLRMTGIYPDTVYDDTDVLSASATDQFFLLLPQLSQVDFTQLLIEASRTELEALAAHGYAEKTDSTITYTGSEDDKEKLLDQMDLSYNPVYIQLKEWMGLLENDNSSAPSSDALFQYLDEEEDSLLIQDKPYTHTHSISGDTVTQRDARTLEYIRYEDFTDPITGLTTRENRPSTWENFYQVTISPSVIDYSACIAAEDLQTLSLNALEPDKIKIDYSQSNPNHSQSMAMVLSRNDSGQYLEWEISAHETPTIRILGSWANDILSDIHFSVESKTSDKWLPLLDISMKQDDAAASPILSPNERTVIVPDRYGKFSDSGYQKELQAAKSSLSVLVLSKLPKDAYPLLTSLLAFISQMGQ